MTVLTIPALRTLLPCKGNYPLRKALQPWDYGKDRVMVDIVGLTAIGFLVCMAAAKLADAVVVAWLTRHERRP